MSVALTVLCLLEAVVSIYLNLGIVLIYTRSWMKGLKLNPSSLIHLVMAANNFTMRFSRILDDFCLWLPEIFSTKYHSIILFFLAFHLYFNYWLTAWLCAYYCLIITNLSHQLVVSIKRNLSAYLPYLVFLTGVGSLAIAFLYLWSGMNTSVQRPMNGSQISSFIMGTSVTSSYRVLAAILGSGLPFIGIVIFLLLTVLVLLKHVQKIGHTGSNVQVHITAMKTMVMFFIASTIFLICDLIHNIKQTTIHVIVIGWYVVASFPTVEAIIIIHASPKLQKIMPRWFCARGNREGVN
uniref:Taste receptor type 2 n=1 Tax=Pyxicephalus adspersus TaxID=30357 RepID=A0AAV3A3C7_PYXAD|nr:TPA: hypothetical protein GDO54_014771 [Pyxicephalus adspersus]